MNITATTQSVNKSSRQLTFQVGLNYKLVGKCNPQYLSNSGAWQDKEISIRDLASHISKGHPWMPALLSGDRTRTQENASYAEVLALDVDNSAPLRDDDGKIVKDGAGKSISVYREEMTIAQALSDAFISQHCALIQPSASHKAGWDKFRLVFLLPRAIEGWQLIRNCNRYLAHLAGVGDPACKDASRYYFGAKDSAPSLIQEVQLPEGFVDDAIAWAVAEDAKIEADRQSKIRAYEGCGSDDNLSRAKLALEYIAPYTPGQGRYNELISMCGGVVNDLGAEGEALLEAWNGFGRDTAKKVRGMARTRNQSATLGTLFYLAQQEGFRFPKREYTPEEKREYAKQKSAERQQSPQAVAEDSGWSDRPAEKPAAVTPVWEDEPDTSYFEACRATGAGINLDKLLHPKLARLLKSAAATLPVNPEATYLHYRSTMAALRGTRDKLSIYAGYTQGLVCWTAILADPGSRKSPNLKKISGPLATLQTEAKERFKEDMRRYDADYRTWQKASKDNPDLEEPEVPAMRDYFIVDATMESLPRLLEAKINNAGTLALYDELGGWFDKMDAYRSGGGDRANWLSLMTGSAFKVNRADVKRNCFIPETAVSLTGCTHPDTIARMMGDSKDKNDGLWDRFRFGFTRYVSIEERGPAFDSDPHFLQLYRNLDSMPERLYQLSPDAAAAFFAFERWIESKQHQVSKKMFSALNKMQWKLGVEILALHIEDAAMDGNLYPSAQIPRSTVERALIAIRYDIAQMKLLHNRLVDQTLDPKVLSAVDLCQKLEGVVSTRDIQRKGIVKKAEEAHKLFDEMIKLGLGVEESDSRSRSFRLIDGGVAVEDDDAFYLPEVEEEVDLNFVPEPETPELEAVDIGDDETVEFSYEFELDEAEEGGLSIETFDLEDDESLPEKPRLPLPPQFKGGGFTPKNGNRSIAPAEIPRSKNLSNCDQI
jgi:hypothetical protein